MGSSGVRFVDSGDLVNATLDMGLINVLRERYWSLDNSTGIVASDIRAGVSFLEDERDALFGRYAH